MLSDLRAKLKKYESKAARCVKEAQQAPDEAGRASYDELAHYYGELAKDFRRVLAKQDAPPLIPDNVEPSVR